MDAPPQPDRAFRLNISIRPETKTRLDKARNKDGLDLNVSQICDRAINTELDRAEEGDLTNVVARLRIENDRRRGWPFRLGHSEGTRWAHEVGSWAEVCRFGVLSETDVQIGSVKWNWTDADDEEPRSGYFHAFVGAFKAPTDYPPLKPKAWGAPAFVTDGTWIHTEVEIDQYWRGWLSAVRDVFDKVSKKLEPIAPTEDEIPF